MSDILSDEEDLARLKSWWGEYGTTILVSVGLALVVIIGWRWWESQQAASIAAASDAYQTYSTAAPAEKASALEVLASEHAGTAYYAFALLDQAKQSIDAGDLATARTHLSAAVDAAPHALLGDLARLRLARVLRGLGEEDAAMNMLTAIKSEGYPAWALEAKGDMHAAVGEVEQAHAAYTAAKEALQGPPSRRSVGQAAAQGRRADAHRRSDARGHRRHTHARGHLRDVAQRAGDHRGRR